MVECDPEIRDPEEAETARVGASLRTTQAGGSGPLSQDMAECTHSREGLPAVVGGDTCETSSSCSWEKTRVFNETLPSVSPLKSDEFVDCVDDCSGVAVHFREVFAWMRENKRLPVERRKQREERKYARRWGAVEA